MFRYALLDRLWRLVGGPRCPAASGALPDAPYFFALAADPYTTLNNSVLKFPPGDPALRDAVDACNGVAEADAVWGQTGPLLLTSVVDRHGLRGFAQPAHTAYPIPWQDVPAMFDPARCEEINERIRGAIFLHMFNEIWRGSGIRRTRPARRIVPRRVFSSARVRPSLPRSHEFRGCHPLMATGMTRSCSRKP